MTPAAPRPGVPRVVIGASLVTALDAVLLALALGGVRPLLDHSRALALVAVWFAAALALAWLRPVRAHQPVRAAREPGWVLPALFLLPLLIPALAAWGERRHFAPLPGGDALRWSGVALAAAGLALRIAAMARLASRFSPLLVTQRAHTLETSGLYAWVRHPGYAGALLAGLGAIVTFGSALGFVLWVPFAAILWRRMTREEALLESEFGADYRAWRARTGRVVPRITGRG